MKITKSRLRRIIKEEMAHARSGLGKSVADAEFPIVVSYADRSEIAYSQDELDDILNDIGPRGIEYSLDSLEDMEPSARPAGVAIDQFGESMKITKRQLRRIIREALMTESASEQAKALLDSEYTITSEKDAPGIRRDTNRITTYTRNDGQPVPPEDLKLLQDRDDEVRKKGGGMARLMGVYTSSISQDGNSLVVKYHRTTAG